MSASKRSAKASKSRPDSRKAGSASVPQGLAAGERRKPPVERIYHIYEAIRSGRHPNATTLGKELNVGERTIYRDLDFVRDSMGWPIAYDELRYGFYFTKEVDEFPTFHMTVGELLSLCVARLSLASYRGVSFERHVSAALEKITRHMRDEISFRWEELDGATALPDAAERVKTDLKLFETVSEALLARQEIEFAYRKLESGGAETQRRARPHSLTCVEGSWYLLAQDMPKAVPHTFALSQMRAVKKTKVKFERDPSLKAEEYLPHGIGISHGGKPQRVRLKARGAALRSLEERPLHSSQKVVVAEGGEEGDVLLNVAVTPELERAVLSWGSEVRVLEPASLRKAIRKRAEAMLEAYEQGGAS